MTARRTSRSLVFFLAISSSSAFASPSIAAMVPAGPELGPLGVSTTSDPFVCARPGGGFVVAFDSLNGQPEPVVQFLDSSGLAIGGEIVLGPSTNVELLSIDCAANGDFYLVWNEYNGGIYGRRYDGTGAPVGAAVEWSAIATPHIVNIVLTPDDNVLVVGWTVPFKLRVFAPDGTPLGPETTTSLTYETDVRAQVSYESDGDFVVADGDSAERFDALGNSLGAPSPFWLDLPGIAENFQYRTQLCRQPSGNLVIVGHTYSFHQYAEEIYARIFDSNLQPLGAAFQVNVTTELQQSDPYVGCGDDGGFVVAWHHATDFALRARQFDASGSPLGPEFYPTQERRRSNLSPRSQSIAVSGSSYLFAQLVYWGYPYSGIHVRAYCDDSSVGCTYHCPGGSTDSDTDGYPDACDPCTNIGGAQTTGRAKLSLKRKHRNPDMFLELARFSQFRFRGEVALPSGFGGFATIDPLSQPVRVRIEGEADTTIIDSVMTTSAYAGAGTAGWTSKSDGRVWEYRSSEESPAEGIYGVRLKSGRDDTVRVTVKARGDTYSNSVAYPFLAADIPPRAIVAFGPQSVVTVGGCTETDFAPGDCAYSEVAIGMRTLSCQ